MYSAYELVELESLDIECYLAANGDLATHASALDRSEVDKWVRWHVAHHGLAEGRVQFSRSGLTQIQESRERKLAKLFLRDPQFEGRCEWVDTSVASIGMRALKGRDAPGLPLTMERISANAYDNEVRDLLDASPESLFLDLGAGLRSDYRDNVVNLEIDTLPSTDVVALGDSLPFSDGTFDGAVCLAVLEHVPDPFAVASELMRVVKPGGVAIVDWPFLQPVHGYPHHYFNATIDGAVSAFNTLETVADVDASVPVHMHPVFALTWILGVWAQQISSELRESFESLTVAEILSQLPVEHYLHSPWARGLNGSAEQVISAGTRLRVVRG